MWCTNAASHDQKSLPRQLTLHWNTPPGMVMLSTTGVTLTPSGMVMLLIPRVTLIPLSDGKDTLEKLLSNCFLARVGFGFHHSTYVYILGCFATCRTITETPSRPVAFHSSCFGSNPRGQVVVASLASHHASVVPW